MAKKKAKRASKKPVAPSQQQAPRASPLLTIPRELRDDIYTRVFSSTRFTSGSTDRLTKKKTIPSRNGLALLLTCRQVKVEVGDSWLGQVLFNFEDPRSLLDTLTRVSRPILSKIRHVRVRGDTMTLPSTIEDYFPGSDEDDHDFDYQAYYEAYYGDDGPDKPREFDFEIICVLQLLPGLRLDQLTVLGSPSPGYKNRVPACQEPLITLTWFGNGWKELRFIVRDGSLLGLEKNGDSVQVCNDQYWNPSPLEWQKGIEKRDGESSAPSVTVYQSTVPGLAGAVLDPHAREKLELSTAQGFNGQSETGPIVGDASPRPPKELDREMMVVVKRGAGVDYEVEPYQYMGWGILERMASESWAEINFRLRFYDRYYLDLGTQKVRDSYVSIDDFEWKDAE